MDEQRRVYLAIVLSVVVLMGLQMIMGPQVAPVAPPTETPAEKISERPALPSCDAAAVPSVDSAQPAELSADKAVAEVALALVHVDVAVATEPLVVEVAHALHHGAFGPVLGDEVVLAHAVGEARHTRALVRMV